MTLILQFHCRMQSLSREFIQLLEDSERVLKYYRQASASCVRQSGNTLSESQSQDETRVHSRLMQEITNGPAFAPSSGQKPA
jgi:hypothetical protein